MTPLGLVLGIRCSL